MKNRKVILIYGKTGSGKTTLAKRLISDETRLIICDSGFREFPAYHCENFKDFLNEARRKIKAGGFFRISYTPLSSEIENFFRLIKQAGFTGEITLLIEEADRLPKPKELEIYDDIITRGRHYNINIMAISLYPYKIAPELRRQATEIFCARTHEPRDIDYLKEVFNSKQIEEIQNLKNYEFLHWNAETGEIKKIMNT